MKRNILHEPLPIVALLAFSCALAAGPPVHAQSADDFEAALFGTENGKTDGTASQTDRATSVQPGSFDASAAEGEKAKTEYLVGGTAVVEGTAYGSLDERYIAETSDINGKLFGKVTIPDGGTLFASYAARQYFAQGYSGPGDAPTAAVSKNPEWNLSELYYGFDIDKRLFVRLGNQLIAWGPSRIWSPVDFINRERANAFAQIDSREGKNGLKLHVPFSWCNAFAFADFSGMTANGTYGDPSKTINLAGRFDFTFAGFEFGFSGYGGREAQFRSGADFSGRFEGTTVYGEMAILPKYGQWDGGAQVSLGFSRSLDELRRWTMTAEAFFNSKGQSFAGYTASAMALVPADERVPLYEGRWYAYLALEADKLLSDYLSTTVSALGNIEEKSYQLKASESFSFPKAVPFTVDVSYFGGGPDREFTRTAGDKALALTLSTKLDF